jgi:hypothetical protein
MQMLRRRKLAGRTPLDYLVDTLKQGPDWIFAAQLEEKETSDHFQAVPEKHLRSLWFTTSKQMELFLAYPDVLLIDATYKTNKYGMPLVQIGGCTPIKEFFTVAYCFVSGEEREDYDFVLLNLTIILTSRNPRSLFLTIARP